MLCTVYREHRKSTRETAGDKVVDNMETTSLSQWTKVSGFTRSVLVLVFYFIVCSCILGINFNVQKMLACMVAGGPAVDFIHPPKHEPEHNDSCLEDRPPPFIYCGSREWPYDKVLTITVCRRPKFKSIRIVVDRTRVSKMVGAKAEAFTKWLSACLQTCPTTATQTCPLSTTHANITLCLAAPQDVAFIEIGTLKLYRENATHVIDFLIT